MEYPATLQSSWSCPPHNQIQVRSEDQLAKLLQPPKPPVQTLPTNEVDKVKLLSQIILRESPIQHDLPLLPQLIDRQRLLRSLISGPSTSNTSSSPLGISLNQQLPLIPPQEALISLPTSTSAEFVVIPSTSAQDTFSISQDHLRLAHQSTSQAPALIFQPHLTSNVPAFPVSKTTRSESPIDVEELEEGKKSNAEQLDPTSSRSSSADIMPSRKRKLSSETTSTCSLIEISTSPHLFEISEKNFTEVFTKQAGNLSAKQQVSDDRPNAQLISILNRCVSNMRNLLNQHGMAVSVDDNGMPVDYSSRPIDEIFKKSRKQLEMSRAFQNSKEKGNT